MQHLVNASFDVVFEESAEARMFSSEDHRFQQQAETLVELDEVQVHSLRGNVNHKGNGMSTVLDCTTAAQARSLCTKHGNANGSGVCFKPGTSTDIRS